MIPNIQIPGDPDPHPEKAIHDARELASGSIDISSLKISSHHVRIFDLMDSDSRSEYENLYVRLADLSRQGKVFISSHTRETLTRPDGSTGWFKYIEWTEFDTSDILGA